MANKKPRKRAYIPPPVEVDNRKSRSGRTVRRAQGPGSVEYYTLPNGRRMRVPPEPSMKRVLAQLPIYVLIMVGITYFMPPEGVTQTNERLLAGLFQGGLIAIMITPMLLWMDRRRYAMYLRITGQSAAQAAGRQAPGVPVAEDASVDDSIDDILETDADAGYRD